MVESNRLTEKRGLKVVVGLDRRFRANYLKGVEEIRDGKYGDLILLRAYCSHSGVWHRGPQAGWTEMRKQIIDACAANVRQFGRKCQWVRAPVGRPTCIGNAGLDSWAIGNVHSEYRAVAAPPEQHGKPTNSCEN